MATLYITEYGSMAVPANWGNVPAPIAQEPTLADQTVSISGSSGQSSAFNAATRFIRVHADSICSVAIGSNPTATTSAKRMAADQTEYFGVRPGHKIAVIANT